MNELFNGWYYVIIILVFTYFYMRYFSNKLIKIMEEKMDSPSLIKTQEKEE